MPPYFPHRILVIRGYTSSIRGGRREKSFDFGGNRTPDGILPTDLQSGAQPLDVKANKPPPQRSIGEGVGHGKESNLLFIGVMGPTALP